VDTPELRRSALERKDRDELSTIATSLGVKPPSRARKAEIVDLILTTVTAGAADESPEPDAAPETDQPAPQPAPKAKAPKESAAKGDGADGGPEEEFDFGEVTTKSDSRGGSDNKGRGDRNRDNDKGDKGDKGGRNNGRDRNKGRNDAKSDGDDDRKNQNDNNQNDDEAGPGNRRPRRRGRGRDQGRDEQWDGDPVRVEGVLDLRDDGYGFLRVNGWRSSKDDAYVSVKQVRQNGLRKGDHLAGTSRPANRNEKNPALLTLETVNGTDPEKAKDRPNFEDLTPLFPDEKLVQELKDDPSNMTGRIIDLLAPIGKGTRGLIVSPPKAGKTTTMKNICKSIETNNPEVQLIVLLVDERPEEVTDMKRSLERGEVAASTFDRPPEEHVAVAEITIERAKRLVESGQDVVIMLDGITRLARAYNQAAPATGRVMSGGLDAGAIYPPKKFFGAARNVEEGGSLTILATALVETGSRMDEVIFEEFKGTGNMELKLDRRSAERRVYPAIDVDASSTRHEELLFKRAQVEQVWKLRRVLSGMASDAEKGPGAGLELLMDRLKTFKTNEAFLKEVAKGV
jgi:transcription termination factor Rho